jgi:hypothetical protein
MSKKSIVLLAALAIVAMPALAGEYHSGTANVCYDCHTMHYSMQHGFAGELGPVPTDPQPGGFWLGTGGPYEFLLKMDVNQLCLECHDGQTFAPDVLATDTNTGFTTQGRSAGALNEAGVVLPGYDNWKGHTLGSTDVPPGYDPDLAGMGTYDPSSGLECIHCHTQHGRPESYRNLGPRRDGLGNNFIVDYVISTTNDPTKDVWINIASYTSGSGDPATMAPYYDNASTRYNRIDEVWGTTQSSNQIDRQCAACHGMFHGGPGDVEIGGVPVTGGFEEFIRHPTSNVNIGALGGGHSSLSRYVAAVNKVKVYTVDYAAYTNTSPGCISCHKAHGNQNPFGLIFMNRTTGTITEEGTTTVVDEGMRNLCGQCHGQGN